MDLHEIIARFPDGHWRGDEWDCHCPAHDDRRASLSLSQSPEGKTLLCCQAGCDYRAILAAVGLSAADLNGAAPVNGQHPPREVVYRYDDEQGNPLFEVVRTPDKQFPARKPGAKQWGIEGVRRVLYGLPQLLKTQPGDLVGIAEGEKDVHSLRRHGLPATCNPGGASKAGQRPKWKPEYTDWLKQHLTGRRFAVFADNDEAGEAHAAATLASLKAAGLDAFRVPLAGLPPKGDVSDWLQQHTTADLVALLGALPCDHERQPGRLLTLSVIRKRPPPEWIVPDLIQRRSHSVLFGPSNAGKTFVALSLAYCVALGVSWFGRRGGGGPVVYVAQEGGYGLKPRLEALARFFPTEEDPPFYLWEEGLSFLSGVEVESFVEEVRATVPDPALVVIDPLALALPGGDENSSRDMGLYNAAVNQIRRRTGASVLSLHHTNADGTRERGHSALRCNAETMIEISATAGMIALRCDKQRDAPAFEDLLFSLIPVGESCVLGLPGAASGALKEDEIAVLQAMAFAGHAPAAGELRRATGLAEATLYRLLLRLAHVDLIQGRGIPRSPNRVYLLTDNGRAALAAATGEAVRLF